MTTATAQQSPPLPVRHDIARAGQEFLVLRHQQLQKGSHQRFYEISRDEVWPVYEKIGTRVVGQWQVVFPEGDGGNAEYDEGYRLARYRSYNHWAATRQPQELGGNGEDYQSTQEGFAARNALRTGSNGVIYLEGEMAPGGPYYLPPLEETYRATGTVEQSEDVQPVRHQKMRAGREIITLRHFKIRKGTFEEFYRLSRDGVWPYFEKMGARIVGQWKVVYPQPQGLERPGAPPVTEESPAHDEAYMMVRYASYEHWQATRPAGMAKLGGDGADYDACLEALERRRELTVETSVRFLQGHFHQSPPVYLPALEESYRLDGPGD